MATKAATVDRKAKPANTGPHRQDWLGRIRDRVFKRSAEQPRANIRKWLAEAAQKASPSLIADTRLRELLDIIRNVEDADEVGFMKAQDDINNHIGRVLIDYLKRVRMRTFVVEVATSVEGQRLHCIITIEAKGRSASRYLDIKS